MTNAEHIMYGLEEISDDDIAKVVANYIACPSRDDCTYDGTKDKSPCIPCKVKWLRQKHEF